MTKIIMGIQVDNRFEEIPKIQDLFTEYGCIIKTRLGLHQQVEGDSMCSEKGLVILELNEKCDEKSTELKERLQKIRGVNVKTMEFN